MGEDTIVRKFEWDYNGLEWTWSLHIPQSVYNTYRQVSVHDRVKNGPQNYGFLVTTEDSYVVQTAEELHEAATKEEYSAYDEVSFVLAFVQSLPYTSDSVTTGYDEYPRFPIETLVDRGGDCEDTAILFAALVRVIDYGAIFIAPPEHYAVGVLGKDLDGYYWKYNNKNYYYCETTGVKWRIGDLPDEYKDVEASLYSIDESQQYVPSRHDDTPSYDAFVRVGVGAIVVVFVILAAYASVKRKKAADEGSGRPSQSPPAPPQNL